MSTDIRLSTVHQGNAFEQRSLALLHKTMSMSLKRVGGKEDGGIDLLGWWWLPPPTSSPPTLLPSDDPNRRRRRRIRVIGQCKAEKKKTGPRYVRELEGVLFRFLTGSLGIQNLNNNPDFVEFSSSSNSQHMIALLLSESEFTKSAILRANSSPIPFFLLHLPAIDNPDEATEADEGNLGMALCNPALCGLLEGRMELRWERFEFGGGGRPALWWGNQRLYNWTPNLDDDDSVREEPPGLA